jgi:hypothetical protein
MPFRAFSARGAGRRAIELMAIVLIVAGTLGLVYGKFCYTKETHGVKLGRFELSVGDK